MRTSKKKIKKSKFFSSKGSAMIFVILIAVVVAASIFFVNGIFTDTSKTPTDTTGYTPVNEIGKDSKNVLQLKTIKFGSCNNSASIGFLVDQSGSMDYGTKENNLKNALNIFTTNFPQDGIIGLRTYSDPLYAPLNVPFDYFKNNKTQFAKAVQLMVPVRGTYSRNAFIAEKQLLDAARIKFPQYKFNLVFISDGIPESDQALNKYCPDGLSTADKRYCTEKKGYSGQCRCFAPDQDPTDIASQIKQSGVHIFTIGYVHDEDTFFQDDLTTLMKNVATDPNNDFYFAPIDNQLTDILQKISTKICGPKS